MRKFVTATVSAALCFASISPAFAQEYRPQGFDGPRGANATVNLRVPLGHPAEAEAKPTYGLTFALGKTMGADYEGRPITRQLAFADLRFGGRGELKRAQLASFDLARLNKDKRLNMTGDDSTLWIVAGVVAAGVAVCLLADCFGDDYDS